ncbi:pirin family protein [Paenibacillus sp. TAF58]
MEIHVIPPAQQGFGEFDGGNIIEQKPIGFTGEGSVVKRIGPLFYWAWAHSEKEGFIGKHPHKAFEIMTYVVQGSAEHGDSLTKVKKIVNAGGAQMMQTGSGVSHEERFIGPEMEGFQIWFEPFINEAILRAPTYNQYDHADFPAVIQDGLFKKTVIGEDSPIQVVADVKMWDIELEPGSQYEHSLPSGRTLAALAIRGNGRWEAKKDNLTVNFQHKDFSVLSTEIAGEAILMADIDQKLRMILIEVPTKTDYPLYPKQ